MLRGETIESGASAVCCGKGLQVCVLKSGAGWYLGTQCPNCGPYSRESGYYDTRVKAELDLARYCRGDHSMCRT